MLVILLRFAADRNHGKSEENLGMLSLSALRVGRLGSLPDSGPPRIAPDRNIHNAAVESGGARALESGGATRGFPVEFVGSS